MIDWSALVALYPAIFPKNIPLEVLNPDVDGFVEYNDVPIVCTETFEAYDAVPINDPLNDPVIPPVTFNPPNIPVDPVMLLLLPDILVNKYIKLPSP
jgi:hypothetical protein